MSRRRLQPATHFSSGWGWMARRIEWNERVMRESAFGPDEALVVRQEHVPDARTRRVVDVLANGVEVAAVRLVVAELDHEVSFVALRPLACPTAQTPGPGRAA